MSKDFIEIIIPSHKFIQVVECSFARRLLGQLGFGLHRLDNTKLLVALKPDSTSCSTYFTPNLEVKTRTLQVDEGFFTATLQERRGELVVAASESHQELVDWDELLLTLVWKFAPTAKLDIPFMIGRGKQKMETARTCLNVLRSITLKAEDGCYRLILNQEAT